MRELTVSMRGGTSDARLLALPFDVYGPNGEVLGRGVVSPGEPATVSLGEEADGLSRVHVLAVRPDGEQLQASTNLQDGQNHVLLEAATSSPHEWLEWVTPFRSLEHLSSRERLTSKAPMFKRRIGEVWVTAWEFRRHEWHAIRIHPQEQWRSDGVRQIVLDVPPAPHLLQVGGEDVAWRLVSLPPGGEVRVALTRRATESGDSIDVTVGRTNPVNELVMSYLTRGASAAADRLAEAWQAADVALYEKMDDPMSAAAGAYVLLKMKRLEKRRQWVLNLANRFTFLADGPIVAAALELQRADADLKRVHELVVQAMLRGLPVFSMGISVLVETMAAIHRGKRESKRFQMLYQAARAYLQARSSGGAYLSFYGRSPVEPSLVRLFGSADRPAPARTDHRFELPPASDLLRQYGGVAISTDDIPPRASRTLSTEYFRQLATAPQHSWPSRDVIERMRDLDLIGRASSHDAFDLTWDSNREQSAFNVFDGDE